MFIFKNKFSLISIFNRINKIEELCSMHLILLKKNSFILLPPHVLLIFFLFILPNFQLHMLIEQKY